MRSRKLLAIATATIVATLFISLEMKQVVRAGSWISFEPSKADCVVAKRRTGKFRYQLLIEVGHQGYDWVLHTAFTPANSPDVAEGRVIPESQTVTEPSVVSTSNSGILEKGAGSGNFQTSAWGFPLDEEGRMSYDCWGIHDAFITKNKRECN